MMYRDAERVSLSTRLHGVVIQAWAARTGRFRRYRNALFKCRALQLIAARWMKKVSQEGMENGDRRCSNGCWRCKLSQDIRIAGADRVRK